MEKKLVLGAEAVSLAAMDEGISGVYSYPGTPATEITLFIQRSPIAKEKSIRSQWSVNEKTAYEAALGMSYAGKRSLVCMKHVGLNVASDAVINSAITGVKGGLVLVVADDPAMHSSQNEQDSRYYANFAMLPMFEPSNQQEAYDCTRAAFQLSEQVKLPVMVRLTTRLAHSRSAVVQQPGHNPLALEPDTGNDKWILLPHIARRGFDDLIALQEPLLQYSETSAFNRLEKGNGTMGIISFGLAYNYVKETLHTHGLDYSVLKISQYPLPKKMIREFMSLYDEILVVEEGYPIFEEIIRGVDDTTRIKGKLDGHIPRSGELTPDIIAEVLGVSSQKSDEKDVNVAGRPPKLCQGCSHHDMYVMMNEALQTYKEKHVFADIGCYTLGAFPPYSALSTVLDMGASIAMAKGASDAGIRPAIAVIGDSTFTHAGMTALLDAVNDQAAITVLIADNSTTAMTGGQKSPGYGKLMQICEGLGVEKEHLKTIVPLPKHHEDNVLTLREEMQYEGVSVIIASRECIHVARWNKNTEGAQ